MPAQASSALPANGEGARHRPWSRTWLPGLGRVLINSVHVRFAPKATEILRCREMTRCASCGLMQRSKKSIIRLSCRRAIRAPCGNFKADRPRGLEIDDQLEVRRLLDRYIGTLGSAQNFSRQSCPLSQELGKPLIIANLCITANLAANVAVGSRRVSLRSSNGIPDNRHQRSAPALLGRATGYIRRLTR